MRIAIDGYEANVEQRLGSSQVAFELLRHLEKIDQKNEYTILLPSPPLDDLPKDRNGWKYKILKPKALWTAVALPLFLYTSNKKPDLIFSPTHYIPRFSPVKRVGMIFDLSYLHFPEMFNAKDLWQLKNWSKFSIENADHIITISNFSKKDITGEYGINKDKITVAYPGFNNQLFHPDQKKDQVVKVLKKYGIKGSYLIFIGTIQPRKNLTRLIGAFSNVVKSRNDNLKLVIVGKTKGEGRHGWMYEETLEYPKKVGIEDKVIFIGFVPTKELPPLLFGSLAFIQPSLWEGFGIPVVEAMACGVPVLVSNTSSLPEVVGDAGLTFDPYSVDQIEQSLRTVMVDQRLRGKLISAGPLQAQKYSWDKMAETVLKVFGKALRYN